MGSGWFAAEEGTAVTDRAVAGMLMGGWNPGVAVAGAPIVIHEIIQIMIAVVISQRSFMEINLSPNPDELSFVVCC